MNYWLESVRTLSYWRYAIFSAEAFAKLFSFVGLLYLFVELADTFKIYTKDKHSQYGLLLIILLATILTLLTRRPVSKVTYKIPQKDYCIEVKIGDLLREADEIIISSNSTFDTDMSSGLIATNSLQGQVAMQFFNGQTAEIDRQIENSLSRESFTENVERPGKKREYPLGTVARVSAHGKNFYFVAMSHMGPDGNAYSDIKMIDEALGNLWVNIAKKGEVGDIAIPLLGTGRGRIPLPRKKIVERIAQSFADESRNRTFSNKLKIVVRPEDASKFSLNLFQVKDYLTQSLHA